MRILALDLGSKRIGIAVSDALGLTASGLKVLESRGRERDLQAIRELVDEYEVDEIVVGLPVNMNGTEGPLAEKAREFGRLLEITTKLPIHLWDERLSTTAATRVLVEADLSRKKRKGVVDKVAAVIILSGYLQYRSMRADKAPTEGAR
ncbi:MAG: Holliday junction resolvase RuvX [Nitrospirota bacterium]|nr:Holliday junction resolvase RuvX [Nitrospirota bacterium]